MANRAARAEALVLRLLPDEAERKVVVSQFCRSAGIAYRLGFWTWSATMTESVVRLIVGRVEVFVIGPEGVLVNCIGRPGKGPFRGRFFHRANYKSVREPAVSFFGSAADFCRFARRLQGAHERFIRCVGTRKDGTTIWGGPHLRRHSADLMGCLHRHDVGRAPQSEGGRVDDGRRRASHFHEGTRRVPTLKAPERSRAAREECLARHGRACSACGLSAAATYGADFAHVIHVHHLKPFEGTRQSRKVDPVRDLCPVCPTCHAVIHTTKPPLTIKRVQTLMERARRSRDQGGSAGCAVRHR